MSTATDTTTDTGVWTELVEHFDEELDCGHPSHEVEPHVHYGDVGWLYRAEKPCGCVAVWPTCDGWHESVAGGHISSFRCLRCGSSFPVEDVAITWVKI